MNASDANHNAKVSKWLKRLNHERKAHSDFREEAENALKVYEVEKCDHGSVDFPIYTANCNILHAALFSKMPRPDVRRPYQDVGDSELAEAVNRCIEHLQDTEDYSLPAHRSVGEWLATGLGVVWYRLDSEVVEMPVYETVLDEMGNAVEIESRDEDGKLITEDVIESQTITQEYHPYQHFRWEPAVAWEDVEWISLDFIKTASQIKQDYGVELDSMDREKEVKAQAADKKHGHIVHHIYDKKARNIKVVCEAHSEYLAEYDDPLGLEGFFPMPRPLMLNVKSGEITPRPDFVYIKTQHDNIQELTRRINAITKGVRDIGFFEASLFQEIASLAHLNDGDYKPVADLAEKLQLAGMSASDLFVSVDMQHKVNTLDRLRDQRESEKAIIYELQGIADIIRGASAASETATAQAIKDKHFQVRLSEKINELRRFWRDSYRILAEIIGEHFTPESFAVFSGMQLEQQQLSALSNELGRTYMIDVETEDTTFEDDEKEREQGIALIRTISEIMNMQQALPPDLLKQMLTFGANLFRDGRVLEEGVANLPDTMAQMQQFQEQLEQMGAENQNLVQQLQEAQSQLAEVEGMKEQRENFEAQNDAQSKQAKAAKDAADAQQTQVETAQMVRFGGIPDQ